jgi:hypothetical protein
MLGAELQQFSPRLFLQNKVLGTLEVQVLKTLVPFLVRMIRAGRRKPEH